MTRRVDLVKMVMVGWGTYDKTSLMKQISFDMSWMASMTTVGSGCVAFGKVNQAKASPTPSLSCGDKVCCQMPPSENQL